ncbi:hypothetical protein PF005_g400 [Phytophthora fragariae]|uniref:MULE transposase domain-containing protein n=1 Tax=Phytophthora fragariae TaxID=53985 RepID=A0A6A3UYV1_9STRA|nr:hypothetical protein PF003_g9812 [Phytophthora fragariae]KAE8950116.1 hypothetical protein PF009_g358 [Phytophthora fragariae]KAE9005174.1 hypothetical protein PF011_g12153 [Phytophthora fragariae]KAE9113996.1 hypothetical protein PF007_g10552 [Phytophthora fragariae]KAE9139988.1 hypothetical protein PF010_g348 [Phytophthora fragariae]
MTRILSRDQITSRAYRVPRQHSVAPSLFVDWTFFCVSSSFYQCVIVMVYGRGSQCYDIAMRVLNTSKIEWSYWHVLDCVQAATGINMEPGKIACDFEQGIINAIGD